MQGWQEEQDSIMVVQCTVHDPAQATITQLHSAPQVWSVELATVIY